MSGSTIKNSKEVAPALEAGRDEARDGSFCGGLLDRLLWWMDLARQRRQLQRLDDHMLRDLGISRAEVEREAGKPFWRY